VKRPRKRAAPPQKTGVAREWQRWAAENLLRGVARDRVAEELRGAGAPPEVIERELRAIEASPIFEAARPFARDARRAAMRAKLARALAQVGAPETIPRRSGVTAARLHEEYVAAGLPVILTDVVPAWRGLDRWTPAALRDRFGEVDVDVTVNRDSDPDYDLHAAKLTVSMPLRELVDRIERAAAPTNDFYLIARGLVMRKTRLRELLDDVVLPEGYLDVERGDRGAALWLGPAGTVTPLHHDTSNILFCQVHGRKAWTLVAPWEPEILEDARSIYSPRDPEKEGALGGAIGRRAVLAPGEALFVPVGWWHHVRALDASVSLAFNNFRFPNDYDWYRPGQVR
jgi:hypothetical protein